MLRYGCESGKFIPRWSLKRSIKMELEQNSVDNFLKEGDISCSAPFVTRLWLPSRENNSGSTWIDTCSSKSCAEWGQREGWWSDPTQAPCLGRSGPGVVTLHQELFACLSKKSARERLNPVLEQHREKESKTVSNRCMKKHYWKTKLLNRNAPGRNAHAEPWNQPNRQAICQTVLSPAGDATSPAVL